MIMVRLAHIQIGICELHRLQFLFVLLCHLLLVTCIQLFKTSITTIISLYVQVARRKVLGVFNPRGTRDSGARGLEEVRIIEMGGVRAILIMSS